MASVIVRTPVQEAEDSQPMVRATISVGESRHDVWYWVSEGPLASAGNAVFTAALVPAMRVGGTLRVHDTVSPRLQSSAAAIQNIIRNWDRRFQRVAIETNERTDGVGTTPVPRGVACFFSGGVDSFYSLLTHREEISHIIFVHGFDVALDNEALRLKVTRAIRQVAHELGTPLIEVTTNLRTFSDRYAPWDYTYHGAALSSVAHLLATRFRKVYIAASVAYSGLFPWGSHPLLDPLWSSEDLEIVHDGCEATRLEKVLAIAKCETAVKWLRVCWENRDGQYNCGRCQKCLRTMASLRLAGVLPRCATFESPLDLKALAGVAVHHTTYNLFRENLEAAESWGNDPELARALRACLQGFVHVV